MEWVLNIFPNGGGLGQSVITTVWVGIIIICFLNLRFGFPLTGLVVPGYLVPLLIISPISAYVIIFEAVIVFLLMKLISRSFFEHFGYAEMFGRDRFFGIILLSILVRVLMDAIVWPSIAQHLLAWDIAFEYASQLYSLGLVIIALTANVMWNGGFRYGIKVTAIQLFLSYLIVRFILMPFTNFSIANLGIMYEAVASSIIAAPKAYIILIITAFLASRANIKYGWEFNGIMLPALLALQIMQPNKLLTTFLETTIILIIGSLLLKYSKLRHLHFEGAKLLLFFFNIGFLYKLVLNYFVIEYYPAIKVTDTFAFGYMLSTLLALKIYQNNTLGLVLRATFQTSAVGGSLAIIIGFTLMFFSTFMYYESSDINSLQEDNTTLIYQINSYKSYLNASNNELKRVNTYSDNRELAIFTSAIKQLTYNLKNKGAIRKTASRLAEIDFSLQQDDMNIYINDNRVNALRGLFVISKNSVNDFVISVPHPLSERLASNSSGLLFNHLKSKALVFGTQATPFYDQSMSQQSRYFARFIEVINSDDVLQLRDNKSLVSLNLNMTDECQFWVYNQLPEDIQQKALSNLIDCSDVKFGVATATSLPHSVFKGRMVEVFLTSKNYSALMSKLPLNKVSNTLQAVEIRNSTVLDEIDVFSSKISAKGSGHYQSLSFNEAALWEFEIIQPLLELTHFEQGSKLSRSRLNQFEQINNVADLVGYKLTIINDVNDSYVMLSAQAKPEFYERGQGIYFLKIGASEAINIQIPRPLYEQNTLEFSTELYKKSRAKLLSVAGSHPYASIDSNVLTPANISSLFNVVYQSAIRYEDNWLSMQIRGHSSPSYIRPSALAFLHTDINPNIHLAVKNINRALDELGVDYEIVNGQLSTRGFEMGTSPQSGYQIFSKGSDVATLWLASDFKENYATTREELLQRFLAISNDSVIKTKHLGTLGPESWHTFSKQEADIFLKMKEHYLRSKNLPTLFDFCLSISDCQIAVIRTLPSNELALEVKIREKVAFIHLPIRNVFLDKIAFKKVLDKGHHVYN